MGKRWNALKMRKQSAEKMRKCWFEFLSAFKSSPLYQQRIKSN